MASDQLYLFTALAAFSRAVQDQLRSAHSLQDVVSIAAHHGYAVSPPQLQQIAHRLTDDYWVWEGKPSSLRVALSSPVAEVIQSA
jgi:hypothetical protein